MFRTMPGLTHADLATLRDSLSVDVLFEAESPTRGASGDWRVRGAPLDTLVTRYQADSRFQTFEAYRELLPTEEVFVSAEEVSPDLAVKVMATPNPVSETLELALSSASLGVASVDVFDGLGRRVYKSDNVRSRDAIQLDVRDWPAGVYTARVRTRNASSTVRFTVTR